ncbi:MAG: hypothetical protein KIH69_016935 [Anaerolineae bacterium]|nr:hypothetical protein [Anaerolineae bacterium]
MMKLKTNPIFILLGVFCFLIHTKPANACSASPDFNAYRDAHSIYAGRIVQWEAIKPSQNPAFTTIRLTLKADKTYKGLENTQISFEDNASLTRFQGNETWAGGGGGCGLFDSDPSGTYVILGVYADNNVLKSNRLYLFYQGNQPSGEAFSESEANLLRFKKPLLPNTGAVVFDSDDWVMIIILLNFCAFALLRETKNHSAPPTR